MFINEEEAQSTIDSIFKSEYDMMEPPEKYKASKIDILANNNIDSVNKPTYVEEAYTPNRDDGKPGMSIEELLKSENEMKEQNGEKKEQKIEMLDL